MFDLDNWIEILTALRKNKLRTFLTGFSVAWGIFMLIVLLASGNGLQNAVMDSWGTQSKNSMGFWTRPTSIPYKGNPQNRQIRIDQRDFDLIEKMPQVEHISPTVGCQLMTSYNFGTSSCFFEGVLPSRILIEGWEIFGNGRFINELDIKERRKVAVINKRMRDVLFKNEDPVGKYIEGNKIIFKVIGVYNSIEGWDNHRSQACLPFTTAQMLFGGGWGIGSIEMTLQGVDTEEESKAFVTDLRKQLAASHQFDPQDERVIGMWSMLEGYLQTLGLFSAINLFILIIGVGTLIAGVVGVSNIMLISVRERTREFGIRKALGATPFSILQSVLMESVLITSIFGYTGMVLGVGLCEIVSFFIEKTTVEGEPVIFKNPSVSLSVAASATVVIVIAGVIAGYFPARKAVKITAIEAMRAE